MMKLSDVDLLKLLPEFMRDDDAVKGLVEAVNDLSREPGGRVKTARVWDQIDSLTDDELDELAYELDIDWYSKTLPIENKRALVKSADLVHSRRGTKWAVEQVLIDIFGSGTAKEWFNYDGKPFHFRVSTDYPLDGQEIIERFRAAIALAKPCRAVLDTIEFAHMGSTGAYTATASTGIAVQASGMAINI